MEQPLRPRPSRYVVMVIDVPAATVAPVAPQLRAAGYETLVARNVFEALELLRRGCLPHVMLLEAVRLSRGVETFLEICAATPSLSRIPRILVMGSAVDADGAEKRCGATSVLYRPVPWSLLFEMVILNCPAR